MRGKQRDQAAKAVRRTACAVQQQQQRACAQLPARAKDVAPLAGGAQGMGFWALQIALNTLWSPVFFGLHKMRTALIIMGFLWASVAATTWCFSGVDFIAGLLFVPYLAWVTVAAALNIASIRLNPKADGADALV